MKHKDPTVQPDTPWPRPQKENTMKKISVGDQIPYKHANAYRTVLAELNGLFLLSQSTDQAAPSNWYAPHQLEKQFDLSAYNDDDPFVLFFPGTSWEHAIQKSKIGSDWHIHQFVDAASKGEAISAPGLIYTLTSNGSRLTIQRLFTNSSFQTMLFLPNKAMPYQGIGNSLRESLIECCREVLKAQKV